MKRFFYLSWFFIVALCFSFAGCGGGIGGGGGIISVDGKITGFVTKSLGGAPVSGSSISISGTANINTTTDSLGKFSVSAKDGLYDVVANKPGFAQSKVQDLEMIYKTTVADIALVQKPVFNPDWAVEAPTVTVTGISNGEIILGDIYNIKIKTFSANPIRLIRVNIGNQSSASDFQVSDSSTLEFTWDSGALPPPPAESYIKISVYDVNYNNVVKFIRIQKDETVVPVLPAPQNPYARSYTFSQDVGLYSKSQNLMKKKLNKKFDPNILELPNGGKIDLKAVPQNASIINVIEWEKVTGAQGYSIYRSDGADDNYKLIGDSLDGNYTNYYDYDPQLTPGVTYYYRIAAYDIEGEGYSRRTPAITVLGRFVVNLKTPANGSKDVSRTPTFSWEVVKSAGESQKYKVGVIGYNDDEYAWTKDITDVNSVNSEVTLDRNKVYEWELLTCAGVSNLDPTLKEYLVWSFASPGGISSSGSSTFTTSP